MNSTHQTLFLLLVAGLSTAAALSCMQCDKQGAWYSEAEHERQITLCQEGLIPPTPCRNHTHTHCIVSWYRSGGSEKRTVTERRCGVAEDVTGCTLYNSKIPSRKVRHLLGRDPTPSNKRETPSLFVEVCSRSCPFGDCVSSAHSSHALFAIAALLLHRLF